jgi:CYTH domain-containing protein
MKNEIERKFLVKTELMPDLKNITPKKYERYFIDSAPGIEERIQKVDTKIYYEKKTEVSALERIRNVKEEISEEKFEELKKNSQGPVVREKFDIARNISILFYPNLDLYRVEVEFDSVEEAKNYVPLEWMGEEITYLPITRDKTLLGLSVEEINTMKSVGY